MSLHEVNAAATLIAEHCDPDANVIFGATIDDSMGDEMRVTVIAAGFGGGTEDRPRVRPPSAEIGGGGPPKPERPHREEDERPSGDDDDDPFDLDIPDFLKG